MAEGKGDSISSPRRTSSTWTTGGLPFFLLLVIVAVITVPLCVHTQTYRGLIREAMLSNDHGSTAVITEATTLRTTTTTTITTTTTNSSIMSLFFNHNDNDFDECAPLKNPPRLELVHIPKTGGSTLENLASQNGISWSYCHWGGGRDEGINIYDNSSRPRHRQCPPHPKRSERHHVFRKTANWHIPPMYFDTDGKAPFNPYQNATLFTVVRDPYERAVSQFKWVSHFNKKQWDSNNATHMNDFLIDQLSQRLSLVNYDDNGNNYATTTLESETYFMSQAHYVPQTDYILYNNNHDTATTTMHVLRLERLNQDFNCLVRRYGLPTNMALSGSTTIPRANKSGGSLSTHNLTRQTRSLIEQIYVKDFEELGYPKR